MDKAALKSDWLLLLTALIWGGAFVAQRLGMDHLGPFTFNGVRFALGAAILTPLALRAGKSPVDGAGLPPALAARPYLFGGLIAGSILFLGAALQQIGLIYTTAGKAGFITGLYVVIVPLLGLIWRNRLAAGEIWGAALAAAGLYLLCIKGDFNLAPGDGLELAGAFFWAGHMICLSWLSPRMSGVRLAWAQFICCAALNLIIAPFLEPISLAAIRAGAGAIIYAGAISVGLGYTFQVIGQRKAAPTHAAIILSLESAFAAISGWLFLNETLTGRELFGCVLMLSGMLAAQLWTGKKP